MSAEWIERWVAASPRRSLVVRIMNQPLTATQLARRCGLSRAACSRVLSDLAHFRLARCTNPSARRSRAYELTDAARRALGKSASLPTPGVTPDELSIFGWLCYRHRAAVVQALSRPMSPSEIKRRAQQRDATLRISSGNVRAVLRLLESRGVARRVRVGRFTYPQFELTPLGSGARELLASAESAPLPDTHAKWLAEPRQDAGGARRRLAGTDDSHAVGQRWPAPDARA